MRKLLIRVLFLAASSARRTLCRSGSRPNLSEQQLRHRGLGGVQRHRMSGFGYLLTLETSEPPIGQVFGGTVHRAS
jgi:hypothetical protein